MSLGVLRVGTGDAEGALAAFDRAIALDPASADARREKSLALEKLGRLPEAEAELRKAVELRPGYWANHNALGVYYWKQGRYDEAERAFREVVELAPDNVRGLANLGALLNAQGRPDEAVGHLRHAMSLRPTYAAASNLALVEFDRGRYAEAARAYEQALALDDRDYRVWRNLALSRYWAPGERPRAEEAFARAARLAQERLAVDPTDASTLADLANCSAYLGERERSRKEIRRALALAPADVEVLATAAAVQEHLGDRAAASGRWPGRWPGATRARSSSATRPSPHCAPIRATEMSTFVQDERDPGGGRASDVRCGAWRHLRRRGAGLRLRRRQRRAARFVVRPAVVVVTKPDPLRNFTVVS